MDAVKFMRERDRLLNSLGRKEKDCVGANCSKCVFYSQEEGDCIVYTEKAVEIVEKWSKENPQKTILQDFLEKYPDAPREGSGEPLLCPYHLGYEKCKDCDYKCVECWNRPLEG